MMNVHEVGTDLPTLVDRVLAGEEVIFTKAGRPVAKLVPYERLPTRRIPDEYAGQMNVPEDFDETPQEMIDEFEKGDLS
jgi:prevent-host-death family protein